MRRSENRPSPAPSRDTAPPMPYDTASDQWARRLTEANLRSLTSDYLMPPEQSRTDDMIDAHTEFLRRESLGLLHDDKSLEMTPRAKRSSSHHRSRK